MARLNIEEKMLNDIRFEAFIDRVGNKRRAIGEWVAVAFVAQKYWGDNKKLIPDEIWELGNFHPDLLTCKIIEKQEEGYYLKGSEEYFNWYLSRCELSKKAVIAKKEIARIKHETNHMVNRMDNHVDLHLVNHMVDHTVNQVADLLVNPPTPTPTPIKKNIYIGANGFKEILPEIDDYALPTAARMTKDGLLLALRKWGAVDVKDYVERIHNHIEATNTKYKSIDAVLRNWLKARDDKREGNERTTKRKYDSIGKLPTKRIETQMPDSLDITIPT